MLRKKWDEQTKLQLGMLIKNQLDMHVKLNDAVDRAAEILQAPRSTCMNYWQKELKNLDWSQENPLLSLKKSGDSAGRKPRASDQAQQRQAEQTQALRSLLYRLRTSESRMRELYYQTGVLLNEYASLLKELAATIDHQGSAEEEQTDLIYSSSQALTAKDLAAGDIVRIHQHIWQDYYYICEIDNDIVYGYKLNKNLRIRRKSKKKIITQDMLQFCKIVQRNVSMEEVSSEESDDQESDAKRNAK